MYNMRPERAASEPPDLPLNISTPSFARPCGLDPASLPQSSGRADTGHAPSGQRMSVTYQTPLDRNASWHAIYQIQTLARMRELRAVPPPAHDPGTVYPYPAARLEKEVRSSLVPLLRKMNKGGSNG